MSVYLARSTTNVLASHRTAASDALFINERFEDQVLDDGLYEHCTFANVSFKNATLSQCRFSACVFEGCYFRKTTIDRCRFPASRFIDCEFVKFAIRLSDFSYARFTRCAPPYNELHANLPGEANLRSDLASNLATQCESIGASQEPGGFASRRASHARAISGQQLLTRAITTRRTTVLSDVSAHLGTGPSVA